MDVFAKIHKDVCTKLFTTSGKLHTKLRETSMSINRGLGYIRDVHIFLRIRQLFICWQRKNSQRR